MEAREHCPEIMLLVGVFGTCPWRQKDLQEHDPTHSGEVCFYDIIFSEQDLLEKMGNDDFSFQEKVSFGFDFF